SRSCPLKRTPTPRSSTAASWKGLRGSRARRSGGVSVIVESFACVPEPPARCGKDTPGRVSCASRGTPPPPQPETPMALKATVVLLDQQISDMDRHYYASLSLTLAQHPSESEERLMVRLLAFALYAQERLEFGRGLSSDEDPDLWLRDYTG